MEAYLVQHGDAVPEAEDAERPLSERGREESMRVARRAKQIGLHPARIVHSSKQRARQTAEYFAAELAPAGGVVQQPGLAPKDDPRDAAALLQSSGDSLMLVGHLPHLSRLASLLLIGDPAREILTFRSSAIICLNKGPSGWRLCWILTPELAGD